MIQKVLYFSDIDIGLPNGQGTNEFEFTGLIARKFKKNAWCFIPKPAKDVAHLDDLHVEFFEVIVFSSNPINFLIKSYDLAKRIARVCEREKIDLIVTRPGQTPLTLVLLQRIFKIPVAIKQIGRWTPFDDVLSFKDAIVWKIHEKLYTSVMRKSISIDAITDEWFERTIAYFKSDEKVNLVVNGANVTRFTIQDEKPDLPEVDLKGGWPVLGFAGSVPTHRGALQIVESVYKLQSALPNICGVIVGHDGDLVEIKNRAEKYSILDRCHFLGFLPYERIPDIMMNFDIGFNFFDPWLVAKTGNASQKSRQYLACGKPVISVKQGHQFLVDNDLGSVMDAEDLDQIAEGVEYWAMRLKKEPTLPTHLRKYAVDNFSIQVAFEKRLKFWESKLPSK